MIVGREKIHETVGKMLDKLDDEDELVEIDEVFLIVAVHYGPAENEDGEVGSLIYRCTSGRLYVQFGLLEQTARAVDENVGKYDD